MLFTGAAFFTDIAFIIGETPGLDLAEGIAEIGLPVLGSRVCFGNSDFESEEMELMWLEVLVDRLFRLDLESPLFFSEAGVEITGVPVPESGLIGEDGTSSDVRSPEMSLLSASETSSSDLSFPASPLRPLGLDLRKELWSSSA